MGFASHHVDNSQMEGKDFTWKAGHAALSTSTVPHSLRTAAEEAVLDGTVCVCLCGHKSDDIFVH